MNRRNLLQLAAAGAAAAFQDNAVERVSAAASSVNGRSAEEIASDEDFWSEVRSAFSVDRNIINFNNGYCSPSPRTVQDAMRRYLEYSDMGPWHTMVNVLERQVERCAAAWRRPRAATPKRSPSPATPASPWRMRSTAST